MKKNYIAPSAKVLNAQLQTVICAGSFEKSTTKVTDAKNILGHEVEFDDEDYDF